jgi:hypothetical protein
VGPREDILRLQQRQRGSSTSASNYDPRSTTLLQSQLKKIAAASDPKAIARAKTVAKGGGGSWPTRALSDTLSAIGLPMRAVIAAIDEGSEAGLGKRDTKTFMDKIKDPSYGFGKVIEHYAPNLPRPLKLAGGLAGDVAFDPLTYLSFGVGPTLEAIGKGKGLIRLAEQGAKYAEEIGKVAEVGGKVDEAANAVKSADELRRIATKAKSGKALADEELRHVEKASQFMASDVRGVKTAVKEGEQLALPAAMTEPEQMFGTRLSEMSKGQFAGVRNLPDESLKYGISWHIPFTEKGWTLPGTAGFGRALTETGEQISKGVSKVAGKALGGQLAGVNKALASEIPDLVEKASGLNDAIRRGRAAKSAVERIAGEQAGNAVRTLQDAGIDGPTLMAALGERPMTSEMLAKAAEAAGIPPEGVVKWIGERGGKVAGGQAWRDVVNSAADNPALREKITTALDQVGRFYDSVPEGSINWTRAQGVERQFIGDAAKRGRTSYVPRVLSDEFKSWLIEKTGAAGHKIRPAPGKESWFQKKALAVGDKIGEGDTARELYDTGVRNELYPKGAPGLEQQIDDALGTLYGDAKVPWYEPDFYKAHERYVTGLGHQAENQTVQNTLAARGLTRPTLGHQLRDATQSLWREDLMGPFDPRTGGRRSYSGKVLNDVEYGRFQEILRKGDPAVAAVKNQWGANLDEAVAHVDNEIAKLHQEMAEVGLLDDAHLAGLAEQERLWGLVKDKWTEAINMSADDPLRDHVMLDAARQQIGATIYGHNATWETMTKDKSFIKKMSDVLSQGHEGYGFGREAPSDVVGMLKDIASTYESSDSALNEFIVKHYDPVNHWLKGWLTTSPGFLERNIFGGTFNNWLANVRNPAWTTVKVGKILRSKNRSVGEEAFHDLLNHMGLLNSGFFTSDLGSDVGGRLIDLGHGPNKAWSVNPFAGIAGGEKSPLLPFMNRRVNERFVEPMLRGTLAYDRVTKALEQGRFASLGIHKLEDITDKELAGRFVQEVRDSGLMDEVLADVAKYHFDYEDLSRFERQVGRRVIPFYTWTRKNIPLQLEAMFTKPGRTLAAYGHVKRNLEGMTPQQDVVPQWFGTEGLMRLPFQQPGGQTYGGVQLPFKDVFNALDVTGMGLGMVSPLIKAPIEARQGKQFFGDLPLRDDTQVGGLKPMPTTWKWMIPMLVAADKIPFSPLHAPVKAKGGQWMMREDDNYLVQQYLPFMAQAQRLFPMEEGKYRNRLLTTWLSYMMGVQMRTNTPQDMENEVFRRSDELAGVVNRLKATGAIPKPASTTKKRQGPPLSKVIASLNTG